LKSDWRPQAVTDGPSLLRSCGKRTLSDNSNCWISNYPDFFIIYIPSTEGAVIS